MRLNSTSVSPDMRPSHYQTMFHVERDHWWYRVRREIVLDVFHALRVDLPAMPKILDVGCGAGGLMKALEPFGEVHGIDISSDVVEFCRARGSDRVMVGSMSNIPYPDHAFDVVFALDVLEHINDDRAGLREIHRVLRPGGFLVLTVPAFQFLWGITDTLSDHMRRYTRVPLVKKITAASFRVLRSTYFNTILFLPIAFIRLSVRMFGVRMRSETFTPGSMNALLYHLFHFEKKLLRFTNFPFGVSLLVVAQK